MQLNIESVAKFAKKYFDSAFLFLPFTSLHPLCLYLSLVTSVTLYRDRSIIRKVLLLNVILLVDLLKNVYLSVFLPPNPLDRIRLADLLYITTGENSSYQIWIFLQAMLLYFNYILLTVKPVFLYFLESLLLNQTQPLLTGIYRTSRSPLKNCQQSALWSLNTIGLLKILCDILYLLICATVLNEAIHHPGEFLGNPLVFPHLFIWRIFQVIVGLIGSFLAFFVYATVCPNVAAFGCAILTLLFFRLQLNAKQLTVWKASFQNHFTWSPLVRYRAYNLKTFSLLFIANEVLGTWKESLGRLFVAFMAVNVPVSAFCFVFLAIGGLNLKTKLIFILLMLQGLTCALPIHWFLARLTKRLHAPSKTLLALSSFVSRRNGNLRARLTLHLAICHLHTDRKYGFTYGSFGLVTMGSFGKCMIIYSELILYSYKLIRGI